MPNHKYSSIDKSDDITLDKTKKEFYAQKSVIKVALPIFIGSFSFLLLIIYLTRPHSNSYNHIRNSNNSYREILSFFNLEWDTKSVSPDLLLTIQEDFLDKPFLLEIFYNAGSIDDSGEQQTISHLPRTQSEYDVFSLKYSKSKDVILLYKPQYEYLSSTGEALLNSGIVFPFVPIENSKGRIKIKFSDIFVCGVKIIGGIPKICNKGDVYIKNVLGFKQNFLLMLSIATEVDGETISQDVTFSFVLLPDIPAVSRVKTTGIGYFTTHFQSFGINSVYEGETKSSDILHSVDKNVYVINRFNLKANPLITFILDSSIPKNLRPYVKGAVEDWNKAFYAAGYAEKVLVAITPEDRTYPDDFIVGDVRYNSISWSVSLEETFALGPSTIDPRSGEILNANIVITSGWLKSWLNKISFSELVQKEIYHPTSNQLNRLWGNGVKSVILHEVGHTLGLRHNFIASSIFPYEQLTNKSYLLSHQLSDSVMDYLPIHLCQCFSFEDIIAKGFMTTIGEYDKYAITYGYGKLTNDSVIAKIGDRKVEMPFKSKRFTNFFKNKFTTKHRYSSDENLDNNDFFSAPFDLSDKPHLVLIDDLNFIKNIRRLPLLTVSNHDRYDFEVDIYNKIYFVALRLIRLLRAKIYLKSDSGQEIHGVDVAHKNDILEAILTLFSSREDYIDLTASLKAFKPKGKCSGIATYCDGDAYLDVYEIFFKIQKTILAQLLSENTLNDFDFIHQSGISKDFTFINTYFSRITMAIVGLGTMKPSTNLTTVSDAFANYNNWNLQLEYVKKLSAIALYNINSGGHEKKEITFLNEFICSSATIELERLFVYLQAVLKLDNVDVLLKTHFNLMTKLIAIQ